MIDLIFKPATSFSTSPNKLTEIHTDYNFKNSSVCFGDLSKMNIFIGENNSGKSRFLRYIFKTNFYAILESSFDNFFIANKSKAYNRYDHIPSGKISKFNEVYSKVGTESSYYSNVGNSFFKSLENNSKLFDNKNKFYFPVLRGIKDYKTLIDAKLTSFLNSTRTNIQNKDSVNHYLNLLNTKEDGLHSFDIYNEVVMSEYFKEQKELSKNILTGGKLYDEIKSMLLGHEAERNLIEEFQNFLQKYFFNEYDRVQLIPNEKEKVLYVKIGDENEREIYNWGDGTQQLITILYSLYKHKDKENQLFFIEEPEMYLHPGILRKFIEVISSDIFKNHQYFITTHSNIILDTSADSNIQMSIFKFKKVKDKTLNNGKDFLVEQCNNGDVSLLNELGVRNSSVFLSNCSIWVEGITDRLYFKHFLKLYYDKYPEKKTFRENLDYTFIEYGGGNVTHFNFDEENSDDDINSKYINNRIFLIADNDNSEPNSKKAKRKQHYKDVLEENFYELKVVEVENLITSETLKKVLIKQNKSQEDIIISNFDSNKDFSQTHLGEFIDTMFESIEIKKYASDSGTIKNKVDFCKSAIEEISEFDKLSDEAKELTEKIYNFIELNNQ